MALPSFEDFQRQAEENNLVPIYTEMVADWLTPVTAIQRLGEGALFLLESVEGGEKWARYSYIGCNPKEELRYREGAVEITRLGESPERIVTSKPLEVIRDMMERYRPYANPDLPPFFGGAIGYFGHDLASTIEDLPKKAEEVLDLDDAYFMFTDSIIIFDSLRHTVKLVANLSLPQNSNLEEIYRDGCRKLERLEKCILTPSEVPIYPKVKSGSIELESNMSRERFCNMVEKARQYIIEGDIIQVVLSQRFSCDLPATPFDIYRALRMVNPSPYMFYLRNDSLSLVGSSPEVMVRLEGDVAELRPIAGTRRRGINPTEDAALEKELLADAKERAEHVMLVDLGRNDLGRIAKDASVEVDKYMTVERYSHVMHLVSNVRCNLEEGKDAVDVLAASFPAGTVSGAPKIRALEIIDELEHERRGPYAGCVGYFSYSGNMDMCITIRTAICTKDKLYLQAGAGIVYDSDPETEYKETLHKAGALKQALELAVRGLRLDDRDPGNVGRS